MPAVQANGITIEYERSGVGEPLLLVMGLGGQLTAWGDDFVDELAGHGFDVIRHDNRDAGLSSEMTGKPPSLFKSFLRRLFRRPADAGYRVDDMADDAAALLDALGIESAHVAGVSMGGMISQALAIKHPTKVRSLCSIMSNPGDRSGGASVRTLAQLARLRPTSKDEAVDASVTTFQIISGPHFDEAAMRKEAELAVERSWRPEGTARQLAAITASPDRTPGLRSLAVPTLVVHGLVDPLVKPTGGINTAQAVPRSRLLMFNDMGHDIPAPRAGEIIDAIVRNARRA